jgi:maleate isomerase
MQSLERSDAPAINYGLRAHLGMMLPSVNTIAEPQIAAMLPPGVSLHTTRLRLIESNLLSMLDRLEEAVGLIADAHVDRIIFHCTAVSMYSPEIVGEITRRVAAVTPIPLVITSEAIVAALRTLQASKIVLMTPYPQATNDREVRFLAHHGITVLRERGLGLEGPQLASVEPDQWYRDTMALRDPAADAYFISCTAVRSADVIEALERDLGRPVITSNQAMLWGALRAAGIDDRRAGFGRLLRDF